MLVSVFPLLETALHPHHGGLNFGLLFFEGSGYGGLGLEVNSSPLTSLGVLLAIPPHLALLMLVNGMNLLVASRDVIPVVGDEGLW